MKFYYLPLTNFFDGNIKLFALFAGLLICCILPDAAGRVFVAKNKFVEQHKVAFQCGYRNKFLNHDDGTWFTDADQNAACLRGKLDILKYCRKVYPKVNVTNIAETSDLVNVEKWCPLGIADSKSTCQFKFNVYPFLCIVGDLKSQLGDIPDGCQFDQSEDRTKCESFRYWKEKAVKNCDVAFENDNSSGQIRSFNVLKPCGLDLFTSYEYMCCSKSFVAEKPAKKASKSSSQGENDADNDEEEEGDLSEDNNNDDDNSYESDDDSADIVTIDASRIKNKKQNRRGHANSYENDIDEYFRKADLVNEHSNYRDALGRLEQRHRSKVSKVMNEWEKLETKYKLLNETDPARATALRQQMVKRYQATMKNLVSATKTERYKLSDVHERRLLAEFHEKFRNSNDRFIKMLKKRAGGGNGQLKGHNIIVQEEEAQPNNNNIIASQQSNADNKEPDSSSSLPTSSEILRSIQQLSRLVEKYRVRTLNHYRHWLRTDQVRAKTLKPQILKRLLANDNLLNQTFRALDNNLPLNLAKKIKPIAVDWWQTFREEQTSDVDNDEILWIGDSSNTKKLMTFYEMLQRQVDSTGWKYNDYSIMLNHTPAPKAENRKANEISLSPKLGGKPGEIGQKKEISPSLLLKNRVHQQNMFIQENRYDNVENRQYVSYWLFAVGGLALSTLTIAAIAVLKRKLPRSHDTFVQVDSCTPEERHVSTMQVNGYVNPTYKYFEQS